MDLSLSRSAVFLTVEGGTFEDDSTDEDDDDDGNIDDFSLLVSSFTQPRNDAVPSPYYPLRREELVDPAGRSSSLLAVSPLPLPGLTR